MGGVIPATTVGAQDEREFGQQVFERKAAALGAAISIGRQACKLFVFS
jgi:hypothetical protein